MEEIMLTKEQKRDYLANSGKCPFCKSTDLGGESLEIDGDYAWQDVMCYSCKKQWTDYYKLWDVEEKV
jgi:hypothetical protein